MKQHKKIYNMIFQEDDLKWQSIIYEMIRTGRVDPWDIDITKFSNEYLNMIGKLKQLNFRISGKVVLTASILLRMKTNRLGLKQFLGMIEEPEEEELEPGLEDFDSDPNEMEQKIENLAKNIKDTSKNKLRLEPKLDRPKKRKVTVFELMSALKKAMEVDERRKDRERNTARQIKEEKPEFKHKKFDILGKIKKVYDALVMFFKKHKKSTVGFSEIIPTNNKRDVIWTFVPLLHLANEGKITLHQKKPFGKLLVQINEKELLKSKPGK